MSNVLKSAAALFLIFSLGLAACSNSPAGSVRQGGASGASGSKAMQAVAHSGQGGEISGEILVFTAASLTAAFQAAGMVFQTNHPEVSVLFNFAGSQTLSRQIAQGAPADVFASADRKQMTAAVSSGRIAADAPVTFAHNRLVVITPASNPGHVSDLSDLTQPGLKIVIAADAVPVGRYTRIFLEKASSMNKLGPEYKNQVLANTVSLEENVKAVQSKVVLGEADAGIVYRTDAAAAGDGAVQVIEIPDRLNIEADYPMAVVADSANPPAAAAWVDFVLSPAGQKVLASYGFIPVSKDQ